jgi:hypothetical protein
MLAAVPDAGIDDRDGSNDILSFTAARKIIEQYVP